MRAKINMPVRYIVMLTICILLSCYGYFEWSNNYFATGFDSYFHLQRIYEVREAFLHNRIPGWLNFVTFHHLGQAISGMYPDISLWPLIYITDGFDPIHQVLVLRILLMLLTFFISYLSLAHRFNKDNSALIAACYTLSGLVLRSFYLELQWGTALTMAFLFPIIFNYMDLVKTEKLDIKLVLKTSLLGWVVLNSHLMSIFVLYLTLMVFWCATVFVKRNYISLANIVLSGSLLFITTLPVLYRYYILSKAKIAPPFSEGKVAADSVMQMITNASIDARATFTTIALLAMAIVIGNIDRSKVQKLFPYIYLELFIVVMGTGIASWGLLESLPFFKNFQNAGWRFMIFASAIPLILVLINFSDKAAKKISVILLLLTVISAVSVVTGYIKNSKNWDELSNKTDRIVNADEWTKVTSTGINSDKIVRNIVPDYAPSEIRTVNGEGGVLTEDIQKKIINNTVENNGKPVTSKLSYAPNEVVYSMQKVSAGKLVLPVWGYSTLKYNITENGKKVDYTINEDGWLMLEVKDTSKATIRVQYAYPKTYVYLLLLSVIGLGCSLIALLFLKHISRLSQVP